jgi:hypothetical protein
LFFADSFITFTDRRLFMSNYLDLSQQALTLNRDLLINTLQTLNITEVRANYQGGGDSGDVMDFDVIPESLSPLLHSEKLDYHSVRGEFVDGHYQYLSSNQPTPLNEALTDFVLSWIGMHHCGWENNEGGQGVMIVDVLSNGFDLNHTEFYVESTQYEYQL